MCEIFGLTANKKLNTNKWLKEFFSHSDNHPNGWGIALFDGSNVSIEKEPKKASTSHYLKSRLEETIETYSLFAHIRLATIGDDSYSNSHPFVAFDNSGRAWTLVHNGTIFEAPILNGFHHFQKGSTDSERILLYIVDQVNKQLSNNPDFYKGERRFHLVENIVKELAPENKLNLLIYDGEYMYVHKNAAHTLYKNESSGACLFSTQKLSNYNWTEVADNTLLVYKDGSLVYTGTAHEHTYIEDPEKLKIIFMEYSHL